MRQSGHPPSAQGGGRVQGLVCRAICPHSIFMVDWRPRQFFLDELLVAAPRRDGTRGHGCLRPS